MHIFGTDIDLSRNEAKNFRMENGIALPSVVAGDSGLTFYHAGLGTFYGWTGATWLDLGASGGGGSYTLPTATDTILGGVKIDNTTITIDGGGVISASPSIIASGFEEVTEGLNTGWRFIGETAGDNVNRYYIGDKAWDAMLYDGTSVGLPDIPSLPYGTNSARGINFGLDNKDNAQYATIVMGGANQTNAYANAVMIGNYNNAGYGYGDTCIGTYNTTVPSNVNSFLTAIGHNVTMNAAFGGVGLGLAVTNNSNGSVVVGTSNTLWTGGGSASDRPMFQVGIGTTFTPSARWTSNTRKDGFTVKFNGQVIGDSLTTALIDSEVTGRVLITREWYENSTVSSPIIAVNEGNGEGYRLASTPVDNVGNIGLHAVDLGEHSVASTTEGALATHAFIGNGDTNSISGNAYGAFTLGGGANTIAGNAVGAGALGNFNTISEGYGALASGAYNTINTANLGGGFLALGHGNSVTGEFPLGAIGLALSVNSRNHLAVGVSNEIYAGSTSAADRPIFTVGIGTHSTSIGQWSAIARKDGFNVLFDGTVIANSTTNALIDAEATGKVLLTREWYESKSNINKIKVTLTASQINTLGTTPVELIPAGGVGTVIKILYVIGRINFGTVAFDENAIFITSFDTIGTGDLFLSQTSTTIESPVTNGGYNLIENTAINASGTDSIAVGDGTVDIYLTYEIITL